MRVDGRNHVIYECDNSSKRSVPGGTVYNITNSQGLEAILLDRSLCTKEKEHQVMNAMSGIGECDGRQITDILYTHGKFRGYVYYKMEEPEPVIPGNDPPQNDPPEYNPPQYNPPQNERPLQPYPVSGSHMLIRVIYLIASVIIIGAVVLKYLYPAMLQMAYDSGSDSGSLFATISFNGISGVVISAIAACACARLLISNNTLLYFVSVPVIAIICTALVYLLIWMIILLVGFAVNIFVALIPTIITIAVIVAILKSIFK